MANANQNPSEAQTLLNIALGRSPVTLDGLTAKEYSQLIYDALRVVEVKELYGQMTIKDLLTFKKDSPHALGGLESLDCTNAPKLIESTDEPNGLTFNTHCVNVSSDYIKFVPTFKCLTDGKTTSNPKIIANWRRKGKGYRLERAEAELLILPLPEKDFTSELYLVDLVFKCKSIGNENFVVTEVYAETVLRHDFSQYFRRVAPKAFITLLGGLEHTYSETLKRIERDAHRVGAKLKHLTRMNEVIARIE